MSGREKKERAGAEEDGPWFLTHDTDEDRDRENFVDDEDETTW